MRCCIGYKRCVYRVESLSWGGFAFVVWCVERMVALERSDPPSGGALIGALIGALNRLGMGCPSRIAPSSVGVMCGEWAPRLPKENAQ